MALPLIERKLGTTNPYLSKYHTETFLLVKSITILCHEEAEVYNERIRYYRMGQIDETDKKTWRYYLHLTGNYHEVDEVMTVVSRDTREVIELTLENLEMHFETKLELSKFGAFYDEVYQKYPQQELLLKALISFSKPYTIEEIIKLPNWTIASWNDRLVEPQETDLIGKLQTRVYNYSVTGMLTAYHYVDDLYLALIIPKLTIYILRTIFSLRLANARTARVHSHHMLLYFASHHGLDDHYRYLDDRQRLFLYRNMLYLNTHAGRNKTFDTIVEVFFTYKRIVLTNYIFQQENGTKADLSMDYSFRQELLNSQPFVYNTTPFKLDTLRWKEGKIRKGNPKEYDYNYRNIDNRLEDSLDSEVKTKDLEVNFNDSSNEVRYTLYEAILDYWATTVQKGYNRVLIEFVNPTDGMVITMSPKDAFKLFTVAFHVSHGRYLTKIPNYVASKVIKEDIPTLEFLLKGCTFNNERTRKAIEHFRPRAPKYISIDTKRDFRELVLRFHRYEFGMDIYRDSIGHLDLYTDVNHAFDRLHEWIELDLEETEVARFLGEHGIVGLNNYTRHQAEGLVGAILSSITDDLLGSNEVNRLSQNTAVVIFNKFSSYTTQTLSEYFSDDTIPAGLGTPRYSFYSYETGSAWPVGVDTDYIGMTSGSTSYFPCQLEIGTTFDFGSGSTTTTDLVKVDYRIWLNKSTQVHRGLNTDLCVTVERITPYIKPTEEQLNQIFNINREELVSYEY